MKPRVKYSEEQWSKISTFPKEFFENYANLFFAPLRYKTEMDITKIVSEGEFVKNVFSEENAYELFHGHIEGLIYSYIVKNQELFVK